MKYNQLLFIIICFSITTLSDAMDSKNNSLDKFLEITTVENPWRAKYITNKTIVIVGDRGNDYGCTFIDLKKEKIQHISSFWDDFRYVSIACLQIHNKKIINSHGKILTIYDAQTGTKEQFVERQKSIRAFACDSSDNLFLCYGEGNKGIITKYNYITNDTIDISISRSFCDIMSKHPREKIMCIADYEGNISLHKLDDTLSKFNTISLPKLRCYFCQYSPDGSYIVAGGDKKLFIIDTDAYSYKCLENKDDEIYCNIAFHPNNLILAILSEKTVSLSRLCVYKQQIVHYWDIKTQKFIIANMPVLKSSCGRDLSFSPDGLEMVIVLEGKCVRAPVPSAVNEKICQYLLFILHQLIEDAKLPEDVMLYCGNILLKTFAL